MRLTGFGYGTSRDKRDKRDHLYEPPAEVRRNLPDTIDLRRRMPPVYDQRHLNSCSANAIAAALWFQQRQCEGNPRYPSPSRLFIYFNERAMEGMLAHNGPVSLRSGYKSVVRDGVCSERLWPYDVQRFRTPPDPRCRRVAETHRAVRYMRLAQSLIHLRGCLAVGQPFAFGFAVYKTFKSRLVKRTGVVSLPSRTDTRLGGHAMLAVGYLNDSRHFIARNSWGKSWGDNGYCYIPYDYVMRPDLAWDFWTVSKTT